VRIKNYVFTKKPPTSTKRIEKSIIFLFVLFARNNYLPDFFPTYNSSGNPAHFVLFVPAKISCAVEPADVFYSLFQNEKEVIDDSGSWSVCIYGVEIAER
jgi:hypothetical protein